MKNLFSEFVRKIARLSLSLQEQAVLAAAEMHAQVSMFMRSVFTFRMHNMYKIECVGADGRVKWTEYVPNTVFTAGINEMLKETFKGSSFTASWFVGLVDNASFSAFNAADTSASHSGWLESTAYSAGTRPALTLGTPSAGSVDNSASQASFSINGTATINGAFIANSSTKSSTTDIIYGAASFGTARSVISGDVLNVTCTLSGS